MGQFIETIQQNYSIKRHNTQDTLPHFVIFQWLLDFVCYWINQSIIQSINQSTWNLTISVFSSKSTVGFILRNTVASGPFSSEVRNIQLPVKRIEHHQPLQWWVNCHYRYAATNHALRTDGYIPPRLRWCRVRYQRRCKTHLGRHFRSLWMGARPPMQNFDCTFVWLSQPRQTGRNPRLLSH